MSEEEKKLWKARRHIYLTFTNPNFSIYELNSPLVKSLAVKWNFSKVKAVDVLWTTLFWFFIFCANLFLLSASIKLISICSYSLEKSQPNRAYTWYNKRELDKICKRHHHTLKTTYSSYRLNWIFNQLGVVDVTAVHF